MPTLDLVEDETLWTPNAGGQQAFMDDYDARYLALAGGWYAGKTWAGARKLVDLHVHNAFDDADRPTGVDSCVIAQTYQLAQTINIPELQRALDESGIRWRFCSDLKKFWFELPDLAALGDPSLIYVRTADSPGTITGFTVGAMWGDEVARWKSDPSDPMKDPLLQAKGRLRDPRARVLQFLLTFTHEGDCTKVYEDFERSPKPDHRLYRAGTFENPHAVAFGETMRGQLTPELADQYLGGLAANFKGGNVYDNFDGVANVDDALTLDPSRPLQIGFDFNNTPGSHAEVGQFFPDLRLATTVHEVYEDRAHARRLAQVVVQWMAKTFVDLPERPSGGWKFPGKLELFGDASGNNPNEANGAVAWEEVTAVFQAAGIPFTMANVPSANPHVADRVAAMNCAFRNADGVVRYKVNAANCPRLMNDFRTLKWNGNEIDKADRKISHASDSDSYRIFQLLPIRRLQLSGGRIATAG